MNIDNIEKNKQIFITGASGYLGTALTNKISTIFHTKALVRNKKEACFNKEVEVIEGNLLDIDSFKKNLKNCTVLIHAAALVKMWVKDKNLFYKTNVEAMEKLFQIAYELGIKKIIYISSFIAIGPSDNFGISTEDNYHTPNVFNNDYEKSKYLGDKNTEELIRKGIPIVKVYPGVIYGPGKLTAGNLVANIMLNYLNKKILPTICENTIWSYSYIEDVVNGITAAIYKGKIGERYILAGENKKLSQLYSKIDELSKRKPIKIKVPTWLAYFVGLLYWYRAELLNKEPIITHQVVNIFRHNWALSSKKAIKELNYSITPFDVGIETTYKWLIDYIKKET